MNKFNFLVFDGLDLENYEEYQTTNETLLADILEALNREEKEERSSDTSAWMNRFSVLKNGNRAYIIVPSTVPSHYDIVLATTGKYAIFILDKSEFTSFTKDDIEYFRNNLPKQFSKEKREKQKEEMNQKYVQAMIRDTFRVPLMLCSDDTIEILRFLLINKMDAIFKSLVIEGTQNNNEVLQQLFTAITNDSRLSKTTITAETFADEIMLFFTPEIQFKALGLTEEEGVLVYFTLCSENTWLRKDFLDISEKEVRDVFKDFLTELPNTDKI